MGATKIVTDASFADDVLLSTKPVVVDFWAEWCGPCKMVAPILEEIAAAHDGIVIAKLNVDENPQTSASYGITSIPTLNVFQDGKVVKSIIGAKPKAALLAYSMNRRPGGTTRLLPQPFACFSRSAGLPSTASLDPIPTAASRRRAGNFVTGCSCTYQGI